MSLAVARLVPYGGLSSKMSFSVSVPFALLESLGNWLVGMLLPNKSG